MKEADIFSESMGTKNRTSKGEKTDSFDKKKKSEKKDTSSDFFKASEETLSDLKIDNLLIELKISESPENYDTILIPANKSGLPGSSGIGAMVREKLGISQLWKELIHPDNFNDDFLWLKELETKFGEKQICIIEIESSGVFRVKEMKKTLTLALLSEVTNFSNKRIWIPLLGTGSASIPANESLNSIILSIYDILSELNDVGNDIEITIALPRQSPGKSLKRIFESKSDLFVQKSKVATNVPAWLDNPEEVDYLNRTPLAKSIASILDKLNEEENKGSLMIHLQGAWGAGKSTFLNILEKQLNKEVEKKWVVIRFNAWQNQHISPPWWIFFNTIYIQSRSQVKKKFTFRITEVLRRWKTGKIYLKLLTYILLVTSVILVINFRENIGDFFGSCTTEDLFKTSSAFIGFAATLFSFLSTLTSSGLHGSAKSAHSFMKMAQDPMQQVKSHFNSLIKSIRKPVIIYIDDLDRCDPLFVVKLLEGIQTLFKDSKVFYLIAADKAWISKCFEIKYEKFKDINTNTKTRLGYKFLQKMFQFSIRLPNISEQIKDSYWNYILKVNKPQVVKKSKEIEDIFSELKSEDDINTKIKELEKKDNIPESMVRQAAVERLTEAEFEEKTEHILREHSVYLDTNPRSIKRLANYYNIFRNTLILEGKSYDKSKIIRWLVLNQKYPLLVEEMEQDPGNFNEILKQLSNNNCTHIDDVFLKKLIKGIKSDPVFTPEDVHNLLGVS
ncbi:KAP family P-loop NTPase fold protein [Maribellus maritimus]|uniref:KAP family P-loop NTPase fold protein n=1 Tax=Maribellus maritimus TaxID=2870838 RepID=UPI001EEAAA00|nr:P-loop NTPase fold protein [Maribellus maritimus]MCG6191259.1 KAP family NTPase [Maribellus maritimus]